MAPTTFLALKEKRDPLVFSALDWAILFHDWAPGASYIPADLTDGSGVLQTLPAGWVSAGEIQKQAGVNLTPSTQSSNVEGYGSSGPRRVIVTNEGFAIDFFAQEWRKKNLEMYHNTDMSSVTVEPGTGFRARKTSQLSVRYYSAILIGYDGSPGQELFPYFIYPKLAVTNRQAMAGQQGSELGMPMTMTLFEDSEFESLYDFGVAGAGFDAIAADAGFLAPASSIVVHPSAVELEEGEHLQLTVLDNHGVNRTAECTWGSGTPAVATVSSSGLVTAVSDGSATITATLGVLTDTCAVTVPV